MLTMIGKRLLFAIPSLIGVVIVTFLLTRALPGDPAAYFAGPAAGKEAVEQIRKKLGLDKPLIEQFFRYTNDLAHGDFGNSLTTGQPVATEIKNRLPASAELTLLGLIVSIVIAIPLGVLAANRPGSWIDHLCRITTTAGRALMKPRSSTSTPSNAGKWRHYAEIDASYVVGGKFQAEKFKK